MWIETTSASNGTTLNPNSKSCAWAFGSGIAVNQGDLKGAFHLDIKDAARAGSGITFKGETKYFRQFG